MKTLINDETIQLMWIILLSIIILYTFFTIIFLIYLNIKKKIIRKKLRKFLDSIKLFEKEKIINYKYKLYKADDIQTLKEKLKEDFDKKGPKG